MKQKKCHKAEERGKDFNQVYTKCGLKLYMMLLILCGVQDGIVG